MRITMSMFLCLMAFLASQLSDCEGQGGPPPPPTDATEEPKFMCCTADSPTEATECEEEGSNVCNFDAAGKPTGCGKMDDVEAVPGMCPAVGPTPGPTAGSTPGAKKSNPKRPKRQGTCLVCKDNKCNCPVQPPPGMTTMKPMPTTEEPMTTTMEPMTSADGSTDMSSESGPTNATTMSIKTTKPATPPTSDPEEDPSGAATMVVSVIAYAGSFMVLSLPKYLSIKC